jgi:hypothetical protein
MFKSQSLLHSSVLVLLTGLKIKDQFIEKELNTGCYLNYTDILTTSYWLHIELEKNI